MATVYASDAARIAAAAQYILDQHATLTGTGYCRTCHIPGPCPWWEAATAAFADTDRLPRRTPGWTRPELLGARQLTVPGGG